MEFHSVIATDLAHLTHPGFQGQNAELRRSFRDDDPLRHPRAGPIPMSRVRGRPPRLTTAGKPKTPVREPDHRGHAQTIPVDPSSPLAGVLRDEVVLLKYRMRPLPNQLRDLVKGFSLAAIDEDPAIVAAACILDAVWLALHRGDLKTLRQWEARGYAFAKSLTRTKEESAIALPPRTGLSRADAMRKLIQAAKENIAEPPKAPESIGWDMASAVQAFFPSLARNKNVAELAARIDDSREGMNGSERRDPELLAVLALRAFGVKRTTAHNWLPDDA